MDWETHYAERTRTIRSSSVREFLKYADRDGFLSFAGGLPDPALLPLQETRKAVDTVLTRYSTNALQYGPTEGVRELRSWVAARYSHVGATEQNVLITTGSQQGLDLIGRVFLEEGRAVAVQNPTYLAALAAWRVHGATFLPGEGVSPLSTSAARASVIYCIANFQNPTGASVDLRERERIVQAATDRDIPLVEDDPYGELRYEREPLPALLEICGQVEGPVLHLGTFSKILAPGFRVGWIVGPRRAISKLAEAKQSVDLNTSTLCQYTALELVQSSAGSRLIEQARHSYRCKRDILVHWLNARLPKSITWTRPEGGFFVLLTLPESFSGGCFARAALAAGVGVVPGADFFVRGGENTVRLSYSHIATESIPAGVDRLLTASQVTLSASPSATGSKSAH